MKVLAFKGPFFKKGYIKRLVEGAVEETLDYGVTQIQEKTPVRTGKLQSGFIGQRKGLVGEINNDVYYYEWVEKGTQSFSGRGMVKRSIPEINRYLQRKINDAIDKIK